MGLYPNFPTFSYIGADGISVAWNKEVYMVQSFNTNKKYIYWNADMPHQLNASNTMPARSSKQYLVLINDNGVITEFPSTDDTFSIHYDGNSVEAIKERIYGLYEKNEEFGDKFVVIEQDIDGIRQMVGSDGQDGNTLWGKVSEIEQKADNIGLSVKNFEKKYNDDKETDELRDSLNGAIIKLNADLGVFKSEINEYTKDNQITEEEKVKIETQILIALNSKADVDKYVDKVILIAKDNNMGQDVVALESAKLALQQAHENLDKFIKVAISDYIITPSEKSVIIDAFAKYNLRINELKKVCDDVMLLGLGGVISEELAKINIKSDEIILSVSKVESTFKSDSSIAKIEMSKQVEDITVAMTNLEGVVNTSFEDGECNSTEIALIDEKIALLEKDRLDLSSIYDFNFNNKDISDNFKDKLEDVYNIYVNKHNEMISKIRHVYSDGLINDAEKLQISAIFKECFNALSNAENMLRDVIDNIAFNKANYEIRVAKDNMQKQIDDVKNSVSSVGSFIDSTFSDNAVDEIERENISNNLGSFETDKNGLVDIYNSVYNNQYLVGNYKSELKKSYDDYILKYDAVVGVVNSIVDKTGLIDDIDRANMNSSIEKHNEFLALLESVLKRSLSSILRQMVVVFSDELIGKCEPVKNCILDFKLMFDEFFKVKELSEEIVYDYILDDTEKDTLRSKLSELDSKWQVVKGVYDTTISNIHLDADNSRLLTEKYNLCKSVYDKFVADVNGLINKDAITEEDVIDIDNVYFSLASFFNAFIDVYRICVSIINTPSIDTITSNIESQVKLVYKSVDSLRNTMSGVFKDCILNESEKLSIKQLLRNLSSEKSDIDKQYTTLYSNVDLIGSDKTIFKLCYDSYVDSYSNLIVAINNVLEKTSLINGTDRNNMNTAFIDHDVKLGVYIAGANKAVDVIAQNKAKQESEKVDKKYAEIILDPENGISSKVEHLNTQVNGEGGVEQRLKVAEQKITSEGISQIVKDSQYAKDVSGELTKAKEDISKVDQKADSITSTVTSLEQGLASAESKISQNASSIELSVKKDGVISSINASTEGVKIKAEKITITGYVTFNDLSTNGRTTIHGGNIVSDTITADKIEGRHLYGVSVTTRDWGIRSVLTGDGINFYSDSGHSGKLSYDSSGAGTDWEARDRLWLRSLGGYALKLQSSGNMSISANEGYNNIYFRANQFQFNGRLFINNKEINPNGMVAVFG